MSELKYPEWRVNIVGGLEGLAGAVSDVSLRDGVHWVVDDTAWDIHDPKESVGLMLYDDSEADAVRAVVAPIVVISEDVTPVAPDDLWFAHARWPEVVEAAAAALALSRANDSHR